MPQNRACVCEDSISAISGGHRADLRTRTLFTGLSHHTIVSGVGCYAAHIGLLEDQWPGCLHGCRFQALAVSGMQMVARLVAGSLLRLWLYAGCRQSGSTGIRGA